MILTTFKSWATLDDFNDKASDKACEQPRTMDRVSVLFFIPNVEIKLRFLQNNKANARENYREKKTTLKIKGIN